MVKIAVVDDDELYLEKLHKQVQDFLVSSKVECEIAVYTGGEQLIKDCLKNPFDIIFLDIDMPGISGIEIAEKIRRYNDNIILIFVTNMEQLVFESIKYSPFRFVRKSLMQKEMQEVLQDLLKRIAKDSLSCKFSYNGQLIRVKLVDIMYFESFKHTIVLHSRDEKRYNIPYTLEQLQTSYESLGFIRIHKSYIVNYKYIFEINKNSLILDNSAELPVSRHRLSDVKKQYSYFTREDIQ